MTEEKILAFLNLDKQTPNNKFVEKCYCGLNVLFTIIVASAMLLVSLTEANVILAIVFGIVDLSLAIVVVINKNSATGYFIGAGSLILMISKLLIGYVFFAKIEFVNGGTPKFTWIHLLILLMAFWIGVYLCMILYRNYKIIEKNPITKAKKKMEEKYRVPKWLPIASIILSCPMLFVRLIRNGLASLRLEIGFLFFALACIFGAMLSVCLFKCVVIFRFKVYKFFK